MRHLILSLAALCCGAALAQQIGAPSPSASSLTRPQKPVFVPTLPEAPAGLTAQQTTTWNAFRSRPSTKSIKIIPFDPAVLNGNSITVNQDGKSYTFKGQPEQNTLQIATPAVPVEPMLIWKGQSEDGLSTALVVYEPRAGVITGNFTLGGKGSFTLSGPANAPFWVEAQDTGDGFGEPADMSAPRRPQSPASGVQR